MKIWVALGIGVAVFSGFLALGQAGSPSANFLAGPPNPSVGQSVLFVDTSTGSPTVWSWTFGDGLSSSEQSPLHAYAAPGPYLVTLNVSNATGSSQKTMSVSVSAGDTLQLNNGGGHPFTARVSARDPRTGTTASGFAMPQSDAFGYFSLPAITFNSAVPEVFVKVLDGRSYNGDFWVFYGGLTDLEYTLTVTEVATGRARIYLKPAGSSRGGADTSAFSGSAATDKAPDASEPAPGILLPPRFASSDRRPLVQSEILCQPDSPSVGQVVSFQILNSLPVSVMHPVWNFGDGATSTERNPIHTYSREANYTVDVTDPISQASFSREIEVTGEQTLNLAPESPEDEYHVEVVARDPRSGTVAPGRAFAVNNLYGSFSFPALTGDPNNTELVVKLLDGKGFNNQTWVFYAGLTDNQYTMSVQQLKTGITKYYFNESGSTRGGFDIAGFDVARLPFIDSVSPLQGAAGSRLRFLGKNLNIGKSFSFFERPNVGGPLKYEEIPLYKIGAGTDPVTGKDFIDSIAVAPDPKFVLTKSIQLKMDVYVDHYLASGPDAFDLQPGPGDLTPFVTKLHPDHGTVGDKIRVYGLNLNYATDVRFSPSIPATVLDKSPMYLYTLVPPQAQTGSIIVRSIYGVASSPIFTVDLSGPTTTPTPTPGQAGPTGTPTPSPTPSTPVATATPTPSTPVATATPTPSPSPTRTPTQSSGGGSPTPTPTQGAGAPVVTSFSPTQVGDHDVFDIFGSRLGPCNSIKISFVAGSSSFAIPCVLGDAESAEGVVAPGIPAGNYNVCVTEGTLTGCSAALMKKN